MCFLLPFFVQPYCVVRYFMNLSLNGNQGADRGVPFGSKRVVHVPAMVHVSHEERAARKAARRRPATVHHSPPPPGMSQTRTRRHRLLTEQEDMVVDVASLSHSLDAPPSLAHSPIGGNLGKNGSRRSSLMNAMPTRTRSSLGVGVSGLSSPETEDDMTRALLHLSAIMAEGSENERSKMPKRSFSFGRTSICFVRGDDGLQHAQVCGLASYLEKSGPYLYPYP